MKKLLLLLLVLPFLVSCSDDDDNYSNSDIVGTWLLQSSTAKEVTTNNERATQAIKDDIAGFTSDEVMTFTSDGQVTGSSDGEQISGTYSLRGNTLTLNILQLGSASINIRISNNTFSYDLDETEDYQDYVNYLVPNETGVVVSKVITTYTYRKR